MILLDIKYWFWSVIFILSQLTEATGDIILNDCHRWLSIWFCQSEYVNLSWSVWGYQSDFVKSDFVNLILPIWYCQPFIPILFCHSAFSDWFCQSEFVDLTIPILFCQSECLNLSLPISFCQSVFIFLFLLSNLFSFVRYEIWIFQSSDNSKLFFCIRQILNSAKSEFSSLSPEY
jgi:hypothetical protein